MAWFDYAAYEGIDESYAAEVLDDFFNLSQLGFIYQPWVQFSEPPLKGKQVSVSLDPRGFPIRGTVNAPNSEGLPVVRIFTFGGSTTFCYHVSDEHTWPSYLSEILNTKARAEGLDIHIEVTNYGRGFYYPSQETALVADLLKNGHQPTLAIFMDGVNIGAARDVPRYSENLERQFVNMQFVADSSILDHLTWVPMVRFANSVRPEWFERPGDSNPEAPRGRDLRKLEHIINRFDNNRRISTAISRQHSVHTLFFLQPDPRYQYSFELYRLPIPESFTRDNELRQEFYKRMSGGKEGIISLADLFELWGTDKKAIIDDVHYSPSFNHFLAQHVSNHIDLRALSPRSLAIDESQSTGLGRQ